MILKRLQHPVPKREIEHVWPLDASLAGLAGGIAKWRYNKYNMHGMTCHEHCLDIYPQDPPPEMEAAVSVVRLCCGSFRSLRQLCCSLPCMCGPNSAEVRQSAGLHLRPGTDDSSCQLLGAIDKAPWQPVMEAI